MKLENYIADLLYRYDCVIVPNFGGFIANKKSAQVKNNIFTPPFKQISFNSLLVENDGLLANYIASTDKMPYKTAVNFIKYEVQEWIDKLLSEELELEGIGTLYSANDTIHFEPNNKVNFLTDSFGLDAVVANQIERQKQETLSDFNTLKIVNQTKQKEQQPVLNLEQHRGQNNLLKYTAIFLLGATTIGFSVKNYYANKENSIKLAKSIEKQKLKINKIQQATFIIDTPLPTINVEATIEPNNYFIIAGAFRNENNATKKVNELKEKGFNAKIIGKNKFNLTQVAFDSFSDLDEANRALKNIKANVLKEAWLLVKK
jgi:cell division protein FtsN